MVITYVNHNKKKQNEIPIYRDKTASTPALCSSPSSRTPYASLFRTAL